MDYMASTTRELANSSGKICSVDFSLRLCDGLRRARRKVVYFFFSSKMARAIANVALARGASRVKPRANSTDRS